MWHSPMLTQPKAGHLRLQRTSSAICNSTVRRNLFLGLSMPLLASIAFIGVAAAATTTPDLPDLLQKLENSRAHERVEILVELSRICSRKDTQQALVYGQQGLVLAESLGDSSLVARACNQLAWAHQSRGTYAQGLAWAQRGQTASHAVADGRTESRALNTTGVIHWRIGDFDQALSYLLDSLSVARAIGDTSRISSSLNNLGIVHLELGQKEEAHELYQQSLALHRRSGNRRGQANVLNNLGRLSKMMEQPDKALEFYRLSLDIQREIGNEAGMVNTFTNMGNLYLLKGERSEAMAHFRDGLNLASQLDDTLGEGEALLGMGRNHRAAGRPDLALARLNQALALLDDIGARLQVRDCELERSRALEQMGRYQQALSSYKIYKADNDSIFNEDSQSQVAEMQARYDLNQKQQEILSLQNEKAMVTLVHEHDILLRRSLIGALVVAGLFVVIAIRLIRDKAQANQMISLAHTDLKAQHRELEAAVNELQATRDRLRDANEELEDASRCKSEFLASMSHEIRTPLNGIIGLTELTVDSELGTDQLENLSSVLHSADHLMGLLNDVLDLSKIEAGKLIIDTEPLLLIETVSAATNAVAVIARKKGLPIRHTVDDRVPAAVMGDAGRLKQIIFNLLSNALKFTEEGEIVVTVSLATDTQLSQKPSHGAVPICISVKDTGAGIADKDQAEIFDAFRQSGSAENRAKGTGLGLNIVHQLAVAMGGGAWLESQLGVGSTFHVSAILGAASAEQMCTLQQPHRDRCQSDETLYSIHGKLNILVAEDNRENCLLIRKLLRKQGQSPVIVGNGQEAVDRIQDGIFDLVLMDVMMPEMNGWEATREIRKREANTAKNGTKKLPVIGLSAGVMKEEIQQCFAAGMDAFLPKPIRLDDLKTTIGSVLEARDGGPVLEGTETKFCV